MADEQGLRWPHTPTGRSPEEAGRVSGHRRNRRESQSRNHARRFPDGGEIAQERRGSGWCKKSPLGGRRAAFWVTRGWRRTAEQKSHTIYKRGNNENRMSQTARDVPQEKLETQPLQRMYWTTRKLEKKQIEVFNWRQLTQQRRNPDTSVAASVSTEGGAAAGPSPRPPPGLCSVGSPAYSRAPQRGPRLGGDRLPRDVWATPAFRWPGPGASCAVPGSWPPLPVPMLVSTSSQVSFSA